MEFGSSNLRALLALCRNIFYNQQMQTQDMGISQFLSKGKQSIYPISEFENDLPHSSMDIKDSHQILQDSEETQSSPIQRKIQTGRRRNSSLSSEQRQQLQKIRNRESAERSRQRVRMKLLKLQRYEKYEEHITSQFADKQSLICRLISILNPQRVSSSQFLGAPQASRLRKFLNEELRILNQSGSLEGQREGGVDVIRQV